MSGPVYQEKCTCFIRSSMSALHAEPSHLCIYLGLCFHFKWQIKDVRKNLCCLDIIFDFHHLQVLILALYMAQILYRGTDMKSIWPQFWGCYCFCCWNYSPSCYCAIKCLPNFGKCKAVLTFLIIIIFSSYQKSWKAKTLSTVLWFYLISLNTVWYLLFPIHIHSYIFSPFR